MNLFVLDQNPVIAAQYNCDKHITKMVLEIAQMLANCFDEHLLVDAPKTQKGTPRKHSYYNHPVSIWMRKTKSNMRWAIDHALALESERFYRGYKNPHFSISFIRWCLENIDRSNVKDGDLTEFAIAISDDKECRKVTGFNCMSVIDKYRQYYIHDKPFAKWTLREVPHWFTK
jgi:hypothetical protein